MVVPVPQPNMRAEMFVLFTAVSLVPRTVPGT